MKQDQHCYEVLMRVRIRANNRPGAIREVQYLYPPTTATSPMYLGVIDITNGEKWQ